MSSAAFAIPHKSAEAFRTISEVAIELDVPQHVLRFWESRFVQVKPVKRAGGRRYYRPEDVDLLRRIRQFLSHEGYTIRRVQKLLREGGPREEASGSDRKRQEPDAVSARAGRGAAGSARFATGLADGPRGGSARTSGNSRIA